jgi:hypothetical protein
MILVRFILICAAIYLIFRAFTNTATHGDSSVPKTDDGNSSKSSNKKISKNVGDYVDYEEVNKKR